MTYLSMHHRLLHTKSHQSGSRTSSVRAAAIVCLQKWTAGTQRTSGEWPFCFLANSIHFNLFYFYFREFADSLPASDLPEIFGMHENANISFQQKESDLLLSTVLAIQPRDKPLPGMKSSEEIVVGLCVSMLSKLPPLLGPNDAAVFRVDSATGMMDSLGTCLFQEAQR